jgi:hypothetical protein
LDLEDLSFVRNINGIANGPKTAPIIAQNSVFAPLLSAINQRRNAHDMVIIEIIINPVMSQFFLRTQIFSKDRYIEITLWSQLLSNYKISRRNL